MSRRKSAPASAVTAGSTDCTCTACSRAYEVVIYGPADVDARGFDPDAPLKLLDQTHCARCWRPLLLTPPPRDWSGLVRATQLPPGCPRDRSLRVAGSCGHVFHSCCIVESRHCRACRELIRDVRPLVVSFSRKKKKNQVGRRRNRGEDVDGKDEDEETDSESELKGEIQQLQRRIDRLADQLNKVKERRRKYF